MTRKGSLIPSVLFFSAGHVMKLVETLVPMISKTELWMSWSVILLMWPFRTSLSQICKGLDLTSNWVIPDGVQNWQEASLVSIFKYCSATWRIHESVSLMFINFKTSHSLTSLSSSWPNSSLFFLTSLPHHPHSYSSCNRRVLLKRKEYFKLEWSQSSDTENEPTICRRTIWVLLSKYNLILL